MKKHLILTTITLSLSAAALGESDQASVSINNLCKDKTLSCVQSVDKELANCIDSHKTSDHHVASTCSVNYSAGTDQCYSVYKTCVATAASQKANTLHTA